MFNKRITKVRRKLVTKLKQLLYIVYIIKRNAISCHDKLLCTHCSYILEL